MTGFIGFAGYSDSGKTTLISRLVRHYQEQGIRTGVIKHDAHGHYKEAVGSDSSQYIQAGAAAAVVVSPESHIVYHRESKSLEQMLDDLQSDELDLILVEGFKKGNHDQIALFRSPEQADIIKQLPKPPVAIIAPEQLSVYRSANIPFFDPEDIVLIAEFILLHIKNSDC
ncbi:molybdopterin-guanine dinucleotide biosynthesis protein B [Paenibacillus sp. UNC451MF]|uniref:molybdopterin-guanine dinucleotide biosynthesis protein B n=1 Tax=Paenibacillus sp. UNC451MF TaxID=1449063 RepID=UPI00068D35A1|nr:molybdopterin-guanine dinucleotide biosynthesis protein B [Paenibacillus sp. UNC451MF]